MLDKHEQSDLLAAVWELMLELGDSNFHREAGVLEAVHGALKGDSVAAFEANVWKALD